MPNISVLTSTVVTAIEPDASAGKARGRGEGNAMAQNPPRCTTAWRTTTGFGSGSQVSRL